MEIEAGNVYRVKHVRIGDFYLAVEFTDKNFTTGMILEAKANVLLKENEVSRGNKLTVENDLCEFERVQIREAQLS